MSTDANGNVNTILRFLRKRGNNVGKKITIETLALEAGLDYRTISNVELGKVQQPNRLTLVRILQALERLDNGITTEEKNNVLIKYGYRPLIKPPTDSERINAIQDWNKQYRNSLLPSYLVDITQHIIAWNDFAIRTSGLLPSDVLTQEIAKQTVFDLAFHVMFQPFNGLVDNNQEFFQSFISGVRTELYDVQNEEWCKDLISETSRRYPEFQHFWNAYEYNDLPSDVLVSGPLHLHHPDGLLRFSLFSFPMDKACRFRSVQYQPLDATTMQILTSWL